MKYRLLFLPMIFMFTIQSLLFCQINVPRLQREMTTLAGFSFETWKAKEDKVSQFALPVTFIYPVNSKIRVDLTTSPAFTTLNTGQKNTLNGLSDTRIRSHYLTGNDKFLLTFGLNLPTGKNSLTTEEFNVSNVLSIHSFNFRVPNMGQGLDLNVGLATAAEVGGFVVGGGISYLLKGTFKPFKDYDYKYNPGDEISLSAGLDRKMELFGYDARITGDMVYTIYSSDKGNGNKVFKSGNKFMIQCMSYVRMELLDIIVSFKERMKAKNKTGIGDVFEEERKNSNGNELEISGQGIYPYSEDLRLKGLLDLKFYGNNDYDTGGAFLLGFGGGGQFRYSEQIVLDGSLQFYVGSIKSTDESTSLTGFKLSGGLRYYF
ncbi:MAG: hypothetical protein ACE5NG_13650 [bacterium]